MQASLNSYLAKCYNFSVPLAVKLIPSITLSKMNIAVRNAKSVICAASQHMNSTFHILARSLELICPPPILPFEYGLMSRPSLTSAFIISNIILLAITGSNYLRLFQVSSFFCISQRIDLESNLSSFWKIVQVCDFFRLAAILLSREDRLECMEAIV